MAAMMRVAPEVSRAWACLLLGTLACTIERPEILHGSASGASASLSSGASLSGDTSTDESGTEDAGPGLDTAGCDPLLDPLDECGPELTCDLDTLVCVPREGAGLVGEVCVSDDACSPGLICFDGRCRSLCDPEVESTCDDGQICVHADDPIPGICRESCILLDQDCPEPGDACNTALGPGLEPVAVCSQNPGTGVDGDACQVDADCATNFLCTDAQAHTFPCTNNATACCTPICDPLLLPCFGLEPICVPLGIPGQPDTGYCGS